MSEHQRQVIREAILAELKRQGKTRYWLAGELKMHPNHINRSLSEGHDMRASTAEKMLKALGLTICPEDRR